MADRVAEIRRFSERDTAILFRRGFMLSQAGLTEIAVPSDPDKIFVPRTYDQDFLAKRNLVRRYNREFRLDSGSNTMQVFWGKFPEIADLLSNDPSIVELLIGSRMLRGIFLGPLHIDSSTRLSFYQYLAGFELSKDKEPSPYGWCECGEWSGGVLLTVRPVNN